MARLIRTSLRSAARAAPKRKAKQPGSSGYGLWAWMGGVGGALGALLWYAPAAWLASGVSAATAGQVQIADARGTLWQGSGQLVLTGGADSNDAAVLPDRLQWTLRPTVSGLQGGVLAQCCSAAPMQLSIRARWGGVLLHLSAVKINLPADVLSGLGTPWNTLSPQGKLTLSSESMGVEWAQGRAILTGNASLDMTDISSRLSTLRPLGDYRLDLTGGAVPGVQLQTLRGALQLSGSGQWVGSRMRFSGEASATPEREAALANLLNIIGRRQGNKSLISLG